MCSTHSACSDLAPCTTAGLTRGCFKMVCDAQDNIKGSLRGAAFPPLSKSAMFNKTSPEAFTPCYFSLVITISHLSPNRFKNNKQIQKGKEHLINNKGCVWSPSLGLFYISFQAKQGPYRERNSGDRKVTKIVRDPVLSGRGPFWEMQQRTILALCLHAGLLLTADLLVCKPICCGEKLLNRILSIYFS